MSSDIPCIDDRRGLIFTINRDSDPVYQVESGAWAHEGNRWERDDIPHEIRDRVAQLAETGKPGAFVRLFQGELGVYVICEKNIRNLPDLADDDVVLAAAAPPGSTRELAPYDIVVCAKGGAVRTTSSETVQTQEGDYYVIGCRSWSRIVVNEPQRPKFVETTKEVLLLLEGLHDKNFLSMSPDPATEALPPGLAASIPAIEGINCYVLNLSRFQR